MMLPELKLFACGFMGSTLVEIVSILRYYQSLNNLPKRYSSIGFWIVRIALSIGAGGLAIIYEPSSFILAIHIGASTPLLIATLSEKLIET